MIKRQVEERILARLNDKKAIIILGARQTGKTTLIESIFSKKENVIWMNGDEPDTAMTLEGANSARLKNLLAGKEYLCIDEAQRIADIGIKLKLIIDQVPGIKIIATGSSSFELSNNINEPLTGRKWESRLYPFSFAELARKNGMLEETRLIPHRLVYGSYPEVINNPGDETEVLKQLSDSYLYKDILMWERIKKPEKLVKLLQALAFQLGSEVSYNELGRLLQIDKETVEKYIQLLEQTYVIFRLGAFSRNLRKELKRSRKIYFYDNGIRNAIIANFSQPELRNDIGALWENYCISERIKHMAYSGKPSNNYFWRTQDQQEIDYIEDSDGRLDCFEFKWSNQKTPRLSKTFSKAYPEHTFSVITPDNIEEFLT